jgi:hypothetical protein
MTTSTADLAKNILDYIQKHPLCSSKEVHDGIGNVASHVLRGAANKTRNLRK